METLTMNRRERGRMTVMKGMADGRPTLVQAAEPLHGVGAGGDVYLDAERAEQFAGFAVAGGVLVGEGRGAGLSIGEEAAALFGEALRGAEVGEAWCPAGRRAGRGT